ncbi:hypothetical protein LIER_28873 [Lithospermum erythrorhizon]|uniref:RNase H type-1 domain-containing protein n=1 Tax=Lithospermum erythrorhizon TaxID=34254 RepID=A0AAV3RH91_LITER
MRSSECDCYMLMARETRVGRQNLNKAPKGHNIEYALRFAFTATNNEAKYEALANGLSLANALGVEHIHVRMDSQLLVGHVKGDFKIDETKERNQEADRLSQLSMEEYGLMQVSIPVEWVTEEAFRMKEVMNNASEGEGSILRPWY